MDPHNYKDIFQDPFTFNEVYNHPDPFQRAKWREAIKKEFDKMEEQNVWNKIKRSKMPSDRRCVKHKWVLNWKRNGRAHARLVAKGFSQVAGIDYDSVYSPVAKDLTFRLMIVLMMIKGYSALILCTVQWQTI